MEKKKKKTLTFTLDYKKLDETKNYFLEEVKQRFNEWKTLKSL